MIREYDTKIHDFIKNCEFTLKRKFTEEEQDIFYIINNYPKTANYFDMVKLNDFLKENIFVIKKNLIKLNFAKYKRISKPNFSTLEPKILELLNKYKVEGEIVAEIFKYNYALSVQLVFPKQHSYTVNIITLYNEFSGLYRYADYTRNSHITNIIEQSDFEELVLLVKIEKKIKQILKNNKKNLL